MTKATSTMLIIGLIIGIIIGAGIGYIAKGGGASVSTTTVTKTITKQAGSAAAVTSTVTKTISAQGQAATSTQQQGVKTIVITAWTIGPEETSIYRLKNLELAAQRLNTILQVLGANVRVVVKGDFWTQSWSDYKKRILLAFQSHEAPDIILTGHEDIAAYAAAGYIIPLDKYIKKYWDWGYNDFIKTLWKSVEWNGSIWAIPQDTEARPLYFRKDLLRELGWSEKQIEELPEKIKNGEFTLQDLLKVAKEAVDKGIIQPGYGVWHRPKRGADYYQIYLAFGGKLWDPKTGKLVLDKDAMLKMLEWLYNATQVYHVMRKDLAGLPWRVIHESFVHGKLLFWFGGTWQKSEWLTTYNMSEEDFWKNVGFALVPAGEPGLKPVTLSHPLVYMITRDCKHPEIAFLIITLASDDYLNALHAVNSGHLAIRYSEINHPYYAKDKFLKDVAYMLDYTTFLPNNVKWGDYDQIVWQAICAVEAGDMTPQQALNFIVNRMKMELGNEVIIE